MWSKLTKSLKLFFKLPIGAGARQAMLASFSSHSARRGAAPFYQPNGKDPFRLWGVAPFLERPTNVPKPA